MVFWYSDLQPLLQSVYHRLQIISMKSNSSRSCFLIHQHQLVAIPGDKQNTFPLSQNESSHLYQLEMLPHPSFWVIGHKIEMVQLLSSSLLCSLPCVGVLF
jgi:hypothetical protein